MQAHATPKPRRRPRPPRREKQVEQEIRSNLENLGFAVWKTSQPQKPRGMTLGIPDLYAAHARWRLRFWIEVKDGNGTPSIHQLARHAEERAAGGTVVVAWGWSDVQRALVEMGAPIAAPSPPPSAASSAPRAAGSGRTSPRKPASR